MTTTRIVEIARRDPNGQFHRISGKDYHLGTQPLVRIGSAEYPAGDISIPDSKNDVELLHLLLRAKGIGTSNHEVLNVSSQRIKLFRPTQSVLVSPAEVITADAGGKELLDYDYVEFGNDNYQITYLTGEWVTMDVKMMNYGLPLTGVQQYKVTMRQGNKIQIHISVRRCESSPNILEDEVLDYSSEVVGLDPKQFEWIMKSHTNRFSGTRGCDINYEIKCLADCKAPGFNQRVNFVVTLFKQGRKPYSVARTAVFEVVPCGPFVLDFGKPI